jgi:hypothetical protein
VGDENGVDRAKSDLMRRLLGGVGAACFVFACSGSSNSGLVTTDASSRDSFITSYCDQFMPCCTKAGLSGNDSACRAFVTAFAPAGSYDPAAGSACLNEVHAASSSPTFCDASSSQAPSCSRVFSSGGTTQPGGTCQNTSECAPSSQGKVECASVYRNNVEIRKCQVQIQGKAGDGPCVGTVDGNVTSFSGSQDDVAPTGYLCNVADGLSCDYKTLKCTPLADVGAHCAGSSTCVKTAYCDFSSSTCLAKKALGMACTSSSSNECADGAYCDTTQKLCTALIADGSPCTASNACSSGRCVNNVCGKGSLSLSLLCGPN